MNENRAATAALPGIGAAEALNILRSGRAELPHISGRADRARREAFGDRVRLCAIVNARSGACPEDCSFCAQAGRHRTGAPRFPLLSAGELVAAGRRAWAAGAGEFSLVTSGRGPGSEAELGVLTEAVRRLKGETGLELCASLGRLDREQAAALKAAGLDRLHHNLETAPSFFPEICRTHTFADRLATLQAARDAGLAVCSGGIFGLGESDEQRVEFIFTLVDLEVDRVPVNFLNPIPGTPLAGRPRLGPRAALKLIAALRLALPRASLVVCGGREVTLRSLQPLLFWAGANGILTGDYLTTPGQSVARDLEMIADLGLTVERKV